MQCQKCQAEVTEENTCCGGEHCKACHPAAQEGGEEASAE